MYNHLGRSPRRPVYHSCTVFWAQRQEGCFHKQKDKGYSVSFITGILETLAHFSPHSKSPPMLYLHKEDIVESRMDESRLGRGKKWAWGQQAKKEGKGWFLLETILMEGLLTPRKLRKPALASEWTEEDKSRDTKFPGFSWIVQKKWREEEGKSKG